VIIDEKPTKDGKSEADMYQPGVSGRVGWRNTDIRPLPQTTRMTMRTGSSVYDQPYKVNSGQREL
jgi:hypothetical protein